MFPRGEPRSFLHLLQDVVFPPVIDLGVGLVFNVLTELIYTRRNRILVLYERFYFFQVEVFSNRLFAQVINGLDHGFKTVPRLSLLHLGNHALHSLLVSHWLLVLSIFLLQGFQVNFASACDLLLDLLKLLRLLQILFTPLAVQYNFLKLLILLLARETLIEGEPQGVGPLIV